MDEKISAVEVPHPAVLVAEMKETCENACSFHNSSKEAKDVSMPICFLVKEQAKSLVAIQDLQKRVENVEFMQDDVIESLVEIRNYLCGETKSTSNLNIGTPSFTNSPSLSKSSPFLKARRFSYSPSALKSTIDSYNLPVRLKSVSSKDCSQIVSELKKPLPSVNTSHQSQKLFDLAKNKEAVLESDKQDSGLDSDCREQNEIHQSLNKHWVRQDCNDELLQLLDEISERSEILQKQLYVVEENVRVCDVNQKVAGTGDREESGLKEAMSSKVSYPELDHSTLEQEIKDQNQLPSNFPEGQNNIVQSPVPIKNTFRGDASVFFERKPICERVSKIRKRAANRIDSAMVSSVLKETNVVDLQRQVLVYLVENAVLQTKLGEVEQCLYNKTAESEKIENGLKDETRLLMMENRELRINLDECKFELSSLKSKVAMLERVLQSVTVENRELNWQLGESLGLQNLTRREGSALSSSFTFGNHGSAASKSISRRSSLPHQFSNSADRNVTCMKSKLHPSSSNFLDVTIEEPDHCWQPGNMAFKYKAGGPLSSTPLMPYNKLKDAKRNFIHSPNVAASSNQTHTNFQTVKKHLKCAVDKDGVTPKCLEENVSDASAKASEPLGDLAISKFPFNTILEKLKANSDYRLSRRVSAISNELDGNTTDDQTKAAPILRVKSVSPQDTKLPQTEDDPQENKPNCRKGRNIHQRIQDILDRIMAESEETP